MNKSQKKELKIHYYYILCSHVSPLGLEGTSPTDKHVWVAPTISCGGGGDSWVSLILNPEPHHIIPPTPSFAPLGPGSTQKCGCLCHCNLSLFAKRFHCLLFAIGACMNRSQQDAGWHHFGWRVCGGVCVWKPAFENSRGPFFLLLCPCLNPGLSNAWANSGG